jgi:hypothetical protein
MKFLTETQIKSYRRSIKTPMAINESLRIYRTESKVNRITIFLTHKHDEKEFLEGAISLLKTFGVDVYVDWLDEGMPKTTSGETAKRIKEKIKENHKFILLATEAAISSKWCNWELGLGDATKDIDHIALLPVKKDYTDFSGSEYLGIYPYILKIDTSQTIKGSYRLQGTYVIYPLVNGYEKVVPIAEWLRKR